ncbi:hypothetical protein BKA82DRAFT_935157, partial [Pisolithus tinctorius]
HSISLRCNTANDASRHDSHLEHWGRLPDDDDDSWETKLSMRQRAPSTPAKKLAAMFSRSPSIVSRKRSSENSHVREHVAAVRKILPDLGPEMALQAAVVEADTEIMKPPLARTFMCHAESTSWDGEAVCIDSFLWRGPRLSGNMSPNMMSDE